MSGSSEAPSALAEKTSSSSSSPSSSSSSPSSSVLMRPLSDGGGRERQQRHQASQRRRAGFHQPIEGSDGEKKMEEQEMQKPEREESPSLDAEGAAADSDVMKALLERRRIAEERMLKRGSAFMVKRATCTNFLPLRATVKAVGTSQLHVVRQSPLASTPVSLSSSSTPDSLFLSPVSSPVSSLVSSPVSSPPSSSVSLPVSILDLSVLAHLGPAPCPPPPPPPPLQIESPPDDNLPRREDQDGTSTQAWVKPQTPTIHSTPTRQSPSSNSNTSTNGTEAEPEESTTSPYDGLIVSTERYVVEEIGDNPALSDLCFPIPLIDSQRYTPFFEQIMHGRPHVTYLSYLGDVKTSPIFISVEKPSSASPSQRVFIRTAREYTEDSDADELAQMPVKRKQSRATLRALFPEFLHPDAFIIPLKGPQASQVSEDMLKLERMLLVRTYKFGVVFASPIDVTESDMLNNQQTTPEFDAFLALLGAPIVLKGFQGFRGGLDVTQDSTGTTSYYRKVEELEVMYHVAPLLPFTPNDAQQLEKKRHIGNDVVVFVFKQAEAPAFRPAEFLSEFNHVFILVSPKRLDGARFCFQVSVVSKDGVHSTEPPVPNPPFLLPDDPRAADFLLKKAINSERAAMYAPSFSTKLGRARRMLMENLVNQYAPSNPPLSKFKRVFQMRF